mmetsp:Transcript_81118/g.229785  ORF Transcript_81118/g.229785 Transcript_81118/m.229785 type:complete len:244 (-) Transcript_81118:2-733(-)
MTVQGSVCPLSLTTKIFAPTNANQDSISPPDCAALGIPSPWRSKRAALFCGADVLGYPAPRRGGSASARIGGGGRAAAGLSRGAPGRPPPERPWAAGAPTPAAVEPARRTTSKNSGGTVFCISRRSSSLFRTLSPFAFSITSPTRHPSALASGLSTPVSTRCSSRVMPRRPSSSLSTRIRSTALPPLTSVFCAARALDGSLHPPGPAALPLDFAAGLGSPVIPAAGRRGHFCDPRGGEGRGPP